MSKQSQPIASYSLFAQEPISPLDSAAASTSSEVASLGPMESSRLCVYVCVYLSVCVFGCECVCAVTRAQQIGLE